MKKISIILAVLASLAIVAVAFAASTYWAGSVEDSQLGVAYTGSLNPDRSNPDAVLGTPDNNGSNETTFFSLGKEGYVVVKLTDPVDENLEIYEATWGCNAGYANETADVSVSPDGVTWTSLGTADNKSDKTCYNGSGFISSFDLNGQCIQYVKVQDGGSGTLGDGFDVDAIGGDGICQFEITVDIDIKPGSYPNSVNINDHGVVPVAILGSADFDVTAIDPSTLGFEGLTVRTKGNGDTQCSVKDVSGANMPYGEPDGYPDLVCQFVDSDGYLATGSGNGTVTGYLYDGTPITGTDSINLVNQ